MKIKVNGRTEETVGDATVKTILDQLKIRPETVAIAVNFECLSRAAFATWHLKENDEIEILSPHQGG